MDRILKVPARLLILAVALSACAKASSGFDAGSEDRVLLRISTAGGFLPEELALSQIPEFTLYADGRIVILGATTLEYPGRALPPLIVRRVSAGAVAKIIEAAREAGLDQDRTFRNDMIADAGTTTFTFTVDGETYTTSAYALGFSDAPGGDEAKLVAFRDDVFDLERWIDAAELGAEKPLEATAVRVFIGEYRGNDELPQAATDWPLAQPLASYARGTATYACVAFDGADAARVLDAAAEANTLTPWLSGGEEYSVVFRPLLPDEDGCPS